MVLQEKPPGKEQFLAQTVTQVSQGHLLFPCIQMVDIL